MLVNGYPIIIKIFYAQTGRAGLVLLLNRRRARLREDADNGGRLGCGNLNGPGVRLREDADNGGRLGCGNLNGPGVRVTHEQLASA